MISRKRRFLLATLALIISMVLLHERCADILVTRGDGELAAGHFTSARTLYLRALWFHPQATVASERLIFSDLEDASEEHLREAMRVSEQALKRDPNNAAIWTDRGLCASRLGDDHAVEDAFYHAGNITHDGKLLYLSALAGRRLGENIDIRIYEAHRAGAGKRA